MSKSHGFHRRKLLNRFRAQRQLVRLAANREWARLSKWKAHYADEVVR